jgi:IrrE N-terminal-like domain
MTTWREANTAAAVMAAEIHADLDIDLSKPVDVFGVVRELGLILAFAPLGTVSGVYLPGPPRAGIMLHEGHPRTRQRYSAGHELGHHIFEHATEVDFEPKQDLLRAAGERWPSHEKEAEAFAAWFLMPRKLMKSGLRHLEIDRPHDPYDVYALSLWLGTSYTATARQLGVTKLVDRRLADEWAQVPPANLKRALAGEMAPDNLRNDVWWLDGRHHMQPVDARPGDRVVLTLAEIPSSGFSWRFISKPEQMAVLADSYSDHWEPDFRLGDQIEGQADDLELAGGGAGRSFVMEIDPDAKRSVDHLALVKSQDWDPDAGSEQFELLISVSTPMHGVQVPQSDLAINGEGNEAT